MRRMANVVALGAMMTVAATVWAGPEWVELTLGEAGDLPASAQPTGGSGSLAKVTGSSQTFHFGQSDNGVDMYIVQIANPAEFIATTVGPLGYADFDSQLWLFSIDGRGVFGNQDHLEHSENALRCASDYVRDATVDCLDLLALIGRWGTGGCNSTDGNCDGLVNVSDLLALIAAWGPIENGCQVDGAQLGSHATDATNQAIPGPGLYLLAISKRGTVPVSASGRIFSFNCTICEISGPDGPGASDPIVGWEVDGCYESLTGDYSIYLGGEAVEMSGLFMDAKPGHCPNFHYPNDNGYLHIAMVATGGFAPQLINTSTIMLSRTDGVGDVVFLGEGALNLADTATGFSGTLCECHGLGGDGLVDMNLYFDSCELRSAFQLDELPPGTMLPLEVRGEFVDGAFFGARDCILVSAPVHALASKETTLEISGNAQLQVEGLVQVNSSHKSALVITENGVIEALGFYVNGLVSQSENGTIIGEIHSGADHVSDPLTALPEPNATDAPIRSTSLLSLGSGTHNLEPGRYIGGIALGSGVYNFAPGIYFIEGGGFAAAGKGIVHLNSVLIYNTSSTEPPIPMGEFKAAGNALLTWTPLQGSVFDGFAYFQDRTAALQPNMLLQGNVDVYLDGRIYCGSAEVHCAGNEWLDVTGGAVVARKVVISGNGVMRIGGCGK